MDIFVDNDILNKAVSYNLVETLLPTPEPPGSFLILGQAKFVLRGVISRAQLKRSLTEALTRLNEFVENVQQLEPTEKDLALAAEFEYAAQAHGVALDAGESLLCVAALNHSESEVWTGDKRAITALGRLQTLDERLRSLKGRIKCLEQLVLSSMSRTSLQMLRDAICSEPDVDRTLSICFSCRRENIPFDEVQACLHSYVEHLRTGSNDLLGA